MQKSEDSGLLRVIGCLLRASCHGFSQRYSSPFSATDSSDCLIPNLGVEDVIQSKTPG